MNQVFNIITIAIVLLSLDMVYLSLYSGHFKHLIKNVQGEDLQFRFIPAIIAYILLIFAVYYFIIRQNRPVIDAILLGLVIYGVYEGTSYAIIKNWTTKTFIIDTVWGGILFGLTSFIVYTLAKYF